MCITNLVDDFLLGIYYEITNQKRRGKAYKMAINQGLQAELDEKLRLSRAERYACQSVAKKALPNERVGICLRNRIVKKGEDRYEDIKVWKHRKTHKAFYSGLAVCGSVWICPVCAAKISERRRKEMEIAFDTHKKEDGKIALLTLTFSHKKNDRLIDMMENFGQATQKLFRGREFSEIRDEMGLIGRIRVYEVTHGFNGFHPHVHIALFYTNDIDLNLIKNRMYQLWERACFKSGLITSRKHGLDLQDGKEAEAYLSKHGNWSIEQELSKAHIKKAKNESMTPFDFLREYLKNEDEKYLRLFQEYAECFKGKRQVQWSKGLKKRFIIDDKSDEELAKEKTEEADVLGILTYEDWKQILRTDSRSKLLDRIERFGFDTAIKLTLKKESSGYEDSQNSEI